jgi:hypothetical protein
MSIVTWHGVSLLRFPSLRDVWTRILYCSREGMGHDYYGVKATGASNDIAFSSNAIVDTITKR